MTQPSRCRSRHRPQLTPRSRPGNTTRHERGSLRGAPGRVLTGAASRLWIIRCTRQVVGALEGLEAQYSRRCNPSGLRNNVISYCSIWNPSYVFVPSLQKAKVTIRQVHFRVKATWSISTLDKRNLKTDGGGIPLAIQWVNVLAKSSSWWGN